jgi:hypothetical protein
MLVRLASQERSQCASLEEQLEKYLVAIDTRIKNLEDKLPTERADSEQRLHAKLAA